MDWIYFPPDIISKIPWYYFVKHLISTLSRVVYMRSYILIHMAIFDNSKFVALVSTTVRTGWVTWGFPEIFHHSASTMKKKGVGHVLPLTKPEKPAL